MTITDNWAGYDWARPSRLIGPLVVTSSIIAGNGTSGYEIYELDHV